MVSSAPKLTSKHAFTPTERSQPFRFRNAPGKLAAAAGATMATMGRPPSRSARKRAVSSTPDRAPWEQARMQLPQPMHRSLLMATLSPEPSLQNFTGQAAMQEWQLTHKSRSTAMTAGRGWFMGSLGVDLYEWMQARIFILIPTCLLE